MLLVLTFTILALIIAYGLYVIITPKKKKVSYYEFDGGKFKKSKDDL